MHTHRPLGAPLVEPRTTPSSSHPAPETSRDSTTNLGAVMMEYTSMFIVPANVGQLGTSKGENRRADRLREAYSSRNHHNVNPLGGDVLGRAPRPLKDQYSLLFALQRERLQRSDYGAGHDDTRKTNPVAQHFSASRFTGVLTMSLEHHLRD